MRVQPHFGIVRVQPHFGAMPLGGKTAVAQQRGRRPPQILAARGSPSRWRGRPRVGSIIAGEPFPRQQPTRIIRSHAKKGEGGGVRDPRVFCASKNPSFLARWRVRRQPAVRGPAGTGSVGDGGARPSARGQRFAGGGGGGRRQGCLWLFPSRYEIVFNQIGFKCF